MKSKLLSWAFLMLAVFSYGQESKELKDQEPFQYLDLKEEFDLLVDFTFVNPECATKKEVYYSIIIGTAVVGDQLERISVLVPCLSNEYVRGDLIEIKPIKAPKGKIMYTIRTYQKGDEEIAEVFGSDFKAVWGEVVAVY